MDTKQQKDGLQEESDLDSVPSMLPGKLSYECMKNKQI